jgi:DNA modification methylase
VTRNRPTKPHTVKRGDKRDNRGRAGKVTSTAATDAADKIPDKQTENNGESAPPLTVENWPIDKVIPYPKNARTLSDRAVGTVAASIQAFGWRQPIVVDAKGVIIVGHTRRLAGIKLGHANVPVHIATNLTAAQVKAYRLMDNRSADESSWDIELVEAEMIELRDLEFDLALTGFTEKEVGALFAGGGLTLPDAVPDPPEAPVSQLGDVWLCGSHRVLCGDSTAADAVARLCGADKADLVFTDPPYGVTVASRIGTTGVSSAEARSMGTKQIENDSMTIEELTEFLRLAFACMLSATRKGAAWYVAAPHGPMGLAFAITLNEIAVWRHSIVWVKNSLVMGRMDYHYRHEPIYYGWSPGAPRHAVPTRNQDTVWEFDRPQRSAEHPTMKPVELIEKAIKNSSDAGDIVLDPFGGSGSTLIACEKTQRRALLMELDPKYVDVIVLRWQEFTGKKATMADRAGHGVETGRTFEQVKENRDLDGGNVKAARAVKPAPRHVANDSPKASVPRKKAA